MKSPIKRYFATGLAMALACLIVADFVPAQGYPMRQPLGPNGTIFGSRQGLYIDAGVVYKRMKGFRFEASPGEIRLVTTAGLVPPWGPASDGAITGFDAGSLWNYPSGSFLGGAMPAGGVPGGDPTCADCGATGAAGPNGSWNAADDRVGEIYVRDTDGNCTNGVCTGWDDRYEGRFLVADPASEANGADIPNTTELTFQGPSAVSGLNAVPNLSPVIQTGVDLWAPYLEIGGPWGGRGLDYFAGLSWYTVGDSYRATVVYDGVIIVSSFADTFPFQADTRVAPPFSDNWTTPYNGGPPNFNSANTLVFPNQGNRTFTETTQPGAQRIIAQDLETRVDATVVDMKFGGRGWYPLYGLGRLGASTGFLFAPTPYKIVQLQLIRTTADIRDPTTGALLIAANTVISQAQHVQQDIWWNTGCFFGIDLLAGTGRMYVRANIEYDLYFTKPYVGIVDVRFLPRGLSANGSLGLRF